MVLKKSVLAGVLAASVLIAGCGGKSNSGQQSGGSGQPAAASGTLPRNETLYFNGLIWGTVTHFNPYTVSAGTFGPTPMEAGARNIIYETLFLFNLLDGKMYPHIADSYAWNGQTLTVTLNQNVLFNNGSKMTAADVVNSYTLQRDYQTTASGIWMYIDSVTAQGDYTVEIKANPNNWNPLKIEETLCGLYISSKADWDTILATADPNKTNKMAVAQYANLTPVATGAYKPYLFDETKCVLVRDDGYWGKHPSRFGKLPAPKYLVHNVFKDNASGDAAFRAGEVDISQQFISQVWRMWEQGAKVETYIPQAPYYYPGTIPSLIFNSQRPGLDDPVVRRAISMSLDFDTIGQNAMSGYTAPMTASYMLSVPSEQRLVDWDALKPYQWKSDLAARVADANALLDQAGWAKGADGIRAKNGVKLSFTAECPTGWSDYQAALEVVSQSAKAVSIDIQTNFPTQAVWQQDKDNTTFDMMLDSYGGVGPANPWARINKAIGSSEMPADGIPNTVQNWGRWKNDEVNALLLRIPQETNEATLKQLYTQLNILFLQNMPCVGLMYRPLRFHTVNTTYWQGFPKFNDGSNIPPLLCIDGYGLLGLYNLTPVSK